MSADRTNECQFPFPPGDLTAECFLKDYWQQRPLVIRQAFADFSSPISADELAGLACEDGVDSRIVIEKDGAHPWQVIFGPLDEAVFATLPPTHWTLLVNDVEKHIPSLTWILDRFRFIPEWRIDDLMISYAPEGGSVGPHLDRYDTFILQAQGRRRWQVHTREVATDNQVAAADLRVQAEFAPEQEWLLEPGDMIYVPPGVSHYGVAMEDCLSFSIGFRAPAQAEMLESFAAHIGAGLPADRVFRDPAIEVPRHPNEISPAMVDAARALIAAQLNADSPAVTDWLGRFVSDAKADLVLENNDRFDAVDTLAAAHARLLRNPASRFAFWREENAVQLFVDGEAYRVGIAFAEALCSQREIDTQALCAMQAEDEAEVLLALYHRGCLLPA